jgi:hypothetical protein
VVQLREGRRGRGEWLFPVDGDVYRQVQDGGPKVLVVLTVETALLTGSTRSIERTPASGAGW